MSDKPSYLGLLNAIAVAESNAHCYLTEWIGATRNADVKAVLQTVAAREGEHGMSFAKRVNELGFEVRRRDDAERQAKALAVAGSSMSDLEKLERLGLNDLESTALGFLDGIFGDHSIDIKTGELLGRYIAEEHDSGRLLRSCYEQLKASAGSASPTDRLDALEAKVDALCRAVEDVRQVVCAQAMPVNAS
jgi:hypothetical protein